MSITCLLCVCCVVDVFCKNMSCVPHVYVLSFSLVNIILDTTTSLC